MKIAIHQMCSTFHPATNADVMINAIRVAGKASAEMYFAPEMSLLIDRDRQRSSGRIFTESDSNAVEAIIAAAAEASIWVHLGSIPVRREKDGQRLANRTIVIGNDGTVRARYDKMHLFDVALATGESWRESSVYDAGDGPVIVETPLGSMGLTICYDIRFPDLFSALSKAGVDVIAVPAAFTVPTGQAHWHTLLRARAVEAQVFVIAAAQSGLHEDGRQTYGHSLVVDPWGEVLLDMGEGEGLAFAELDLARISEVRTQIPVHANRRSLDMPVRHF
jgi:deaminated glutathione amidase